MNFKRAVSQNTIQLPTIYGQQLKPKTDRDHNVPSKSEIFEVRCGENTPNMLQLLCRLPSTKPTITKNISATRLSKQFSIQQKAVKLCVVIAVICIAIRPTNALRCYTCSYIKSQTDDTCVRDANATERITNCTKKYCTITRQETMHPPGKVVSFIRDCLDKPQFLNKVIEDATFKTFYRSCTTDLCNDSDGKHSAGAENPNHGAPQNMIIKGKDSANINAQVSVTLLCMCVIVHFIRRLRPMLLDGVGGKDVL